MSNVFEQPDDEIIRTCWQHIINRYMVAMRVSSNSKSSFAERKSFHILSRSQS